jgi:peptidoglycan/LPS O-acetylase OafA/YrhL
VGQVCRHVPALPNTLGHPTIVALAFVTAMLCGWLSYRLIEAPLLAGLRGLRAPRLDRAATAAVQPSVT